jgi:hypothetical protein
MTSKSFLFDDFGRLRRRVACARWGVLVTDDAMRRPKHDATIWIPIYDVLMDPAF